MHERLRNTAPAIDATLAGIPPTDPDAVDADLCAGEADVLTARLARLRAALADFDRATIATTHEFCARLLDQLGILVDHDRFSSFLDDPDQLRAQVIDDGYLAWMSSCLLYTSRIGCLGAAQHRMGDPVGDGARLARAGPREHRKRPGHINRDGPLVPVSYTHLPAPS